jgi:hypothetical protein
LVVGGVERVRETDRVGRRPKKIVKKGEKLRAAKATTLRRVRLARSHQKNLAHQDILY